MEKTLHLPAQQQLHPAMQRLSKQLRGADEVDLDIANALWGQKGKRFQPKFRAVMKDHYGSGFQEVDFVGAADKSRERINKWVEERTHGQIRNLLPSGLIKTDTRLILTNAIYFKGNWASPFKEDATAVKPFHVDKDKTRDVPLMKQRGPFRYHGQKEFQALELPYAGEALSLLILLPSEKGTLAQVKKLLTPQTLAQLNRNMLKRKVEVFLPRFKMATDLTLARHLQSMGLSLLFSDRADLSGLDAGKEQLALDEVVHKAFIDVHEKGSEAGAASAAVVGSRSIEIVPVFRADHPFVFLLRDNRNGTLLFMGRVTDPAPMK
jgi:serpin B